MESYTFIRIVGKGSYGEVNLVKHRTDGRQYVIKKLNLRMSSKRERKAAEQEAQLLSQLRHPNIVTYRESWEGDDCQLYIAMGFCEGGDLYHRLKQQKGELLHERQVVEWFVQIAMALQTNIIKVGDLGIARVLENQNDMASTLIGTPYYMSPELFSNKPYNYKSDVWALGCCVYEMATLKHAFNAKDMNSLVYRIVEGKLPQMPSKYSPQLGELIKSMLSKKPEERPDVKHILRQPYIKRQIALFLEATKEKTAKSRKKALGRQPNTGPSSVTPSLSKPECHTHTPPPAVLNKKGKAKEENRSPPQAADKAPLSPKLPCQDTPLPDSLNSTGASMATVSNISIDILPSERRQSKAQTPSPVEPVCSDADTKTARERKSRAARPASAEPHHTKLPCDVSRSAVELSRPLDGPVVDCHSQQSRPTISGDLAPGQQSFPANGLDKNDTLKLLQESPALDHIPEIRESLDSTEKLLEPFVPVLIEENPAQDFTHNPQERNLPQLQPASSNSEPSSSRVRRQKNREKVQGSRERERFDTVPPRPLPALPADLETVSEKMRGEGSVDAGISTSSSSSSLASVSGSSHLTVAASQDRPLSARERRRLKQSQEGHCQLGGPAPRRASCDAPNAETRQSNMQKAAVTRSVSDTTIETNKVVKVSRQQSEEDDCSSSTSSTDRSEGDCKEGMNQSGEMHDLVQLMTQTLKMDLRDQVAEKCGSDCAPVQEFKLNRKYRDTLVLHGKAKRDQVDFHCGDLPSDTTSGPAKVMRAIERLRADVVKGLGVKLLDKVLDIMEEEDEEKRELFLRDEMGEERYKDYAVMVRQLKFFEDVVSREWGTQ